MRVKFWGVRGSLPAPGRACCEAAAVEITGEAASKPAVGGNTPCVSVEREERVIVLDAGSGLRDLGQSLLAGDLGRGRGRVDILLSHTHWDHIQGLPYFAPAYVPGNNMHVFGGHGGLRNRLQEQQRPEFFPVPLDRMGAEIFCHELAPGEIVELAGTTVRHHRLPHPGDSYAYRIDAPEGTIVYATDGEFARRPASDEPASLRLARPDLDGYVDFFRGAEVLVFDAMFPLDQVIRRADWGHSTALAGVELALRAGVHRLLLFHHDHLASDRDIWRMGEQARQAAALDPRRPRLDVQVAYEGLEILL